MEITKSNIQLASEIMKLLVENNCTVRQVESVFRFVENTIRATSTVQFHEGQLNYLDSDNNRMISES